MGDQVGTTVTANRAVLTFSTSEGQRLTFSIPRARLDKPYVEAYDSMLEIIDSGALCDNLGPVTRGYRLALVSTERNRLI